LAQLREVAVVCYRDRILFLHFILLWCLYFDCAFLISLPFWALSLSAYLLFHIFLHLINPILDLINIHFDALFIKLIWIGRFQELAISP
jgi:hypothetical protein